MTLIKNLLVLLTITIILLIGAFLVKMDTQQLIVGLSWLFPAGIAFLIAEDFWRKALVKETRQKQNIRYISGMVIMAGGIVSFIRFLYATTDKEFYTRMGITFLLAVVGLFWFQKFYAESLKTPQDRAGKAGAKENKRWRKIVKMATKAGKEGAIPIIGAFLKYRTVGNSLNGALCFDRPISTYNGKVLSLTELAGIEAVKDEDKGLVSQLIVNHTNYLQGLVISVPEKKKE